MIGRLRATLSWDPPLDDGGAPITHYQYRIEGGKEGDEISEWIDLDPGATSVELVCPDDSEHYYEVRAVNGHGPGEAAAGSFRPEPGDTDTQNLPPRDLESFEAQESDTEVTLVWTIQTGTNLPPITHFEYRYRDVDAAENAWTTGRAGAGARRVAITGMENFTQYVFELRAVNANGASEWSRLWATPFGAVQRPGAPTGLTLKVVRYTAGDGSIRPRIEAEWNPMPEGRREWPHFERYEVRLIESGRPASYWRHVNPDARTTIEYTVQAAPLIWSMAYTVEVRTIAGDMVYDTDVQDWVPRPGANDEYELVGPAASRTVTTQAPQDFAKLVMFTQGETVEGQPSIIGVRRTNMTAAQRAESIDMVVQITKAGTYEVEADAVVRIEAGETQGTAQWTPERDGEHKDRRVEGTITYWNGGAEYANANPVRLAITVKDAESALEVADAEITEAQGAKLAFKVTLEPASPRTATVAWATRDGTAKAEEDYRAGSGTVTFNAGETEKTIEIAVYTDAHDEGEETMWLDLSSPRGAHIADGEAMGTIRNAGPIPKAWIARFGRTVGEQVLEAIESRMDSPGRPGARVTLAGLPLDVGSIIGGEAALGESAAGERWHEAHEGGSADDVREMSEADLLRDASFDVGTRTGDGGTASVWGRVARSSFEGDKKTISVHGDVESALLGAEWEGEDVKAGVVVSHSTGEGGYAGSGEGRIEASLTGAWPWGRLALNEAVDVWGAAGYGAGTLELTPQRPNGEGDGETLAADLGVARGAAGLRGTVLAPASVEEARGLDALTIVAKTDAMAVRSTLDEGAGVAGGRLEATEATVTRLRLGAEARLPIAIGAQGALTPSLELGMRHDGGDAETGFGIDGAAGLAISAPSLGIEAEVKGRALLSHEASGFEQWGIAGAIAWAQNPGNARGAKITLQHSAGPMSASGAASTLWTRPTLEGIGGADTDAEDDDRRIDLNVGYGITAVGGRFMVTPEATAGLSGSSRDWSLGVRVTERERGWAIPGTGMTVSLAATRSESTRDDTEPVHGIGLRLSADF